MSAKAGGAALLLCAFGLICRYWIGEKWERIRLVRAFSEALERMEGAIRWQNLPLPRVLEQEGGRMPCGGYFLQVKEYMESDMTLQKSWEKTFGRVPVAEARELLCRLELSGDAQQITGALHLTAGQLRESAEALAQQQRQKERLFVAAGGCVTIMVIIILI